RARVGEQVVLVGGVEQRRVARALAPENEDVVLERPDRELVDPQLRGLEVGGAVHTRRVPAPWQLDRAVQYRPNRADEPARGSLVAVDFLDTPAEAAFRADVRTSL